MFFRERDFGDKKVKKKPIERKASHLLFGGSAADRAARAAAAVDRERAVAAATTEAVAAEAARAARSICKCLSPFSFFRLKCNQSHNEKKKTKRERKNFDLFLLHARSGRRRTSLGRRLRHRVQGLFELCVGGRKWMQQERRSGGGDSMDDDAHLQLDLFSQQKKTKKNNHSKLKASTRTATTSPSARPSSRNTRRAKQSSTRPGGKRE